MNIFKNIFKIDKKPRKGLIPLEWAILSYIFFTFVVFLFIRTETPNPSAIISFRVQALAIILALWIVYRCIPCRFTMMLRSVLQVAMLGSWYPDIYEFTRVMPNLDHIFAGWEQALFGYQPALVFYNNFSNPFFSELFDMGYVSYYFVIAIVVLYAFFKDYDHFEKTAFIIITSFFMSYVIFLFLGVSGPQFYFQAVGIDRIEAGDFPDIGFYFLNHRECMPIDGWKDGLFYHLLVIAHDAGERPIAAFPSSHVSVTMCLLILAYKENKCFGNIILFFFVLLCFGTVYVRAHYAIDAIAGILWGTIVYFLCLGIWNKVIVKANLKYK